MTSRTHVLCMAIRAGDEARALSLIERGDWLDKTNAHGWETPLIAAVEEKSQILVDALLAAGANPSAGSSVNETPLHRAARQGLEDIVRALLAKGADPNARIKRPNNLEDGETVLISAVAGRSLAVVKLLLEAGADLLATDPRGNTALTWASQNGLKRIATHLEKGAAGAGSQLGLHAAVEAKAMARVDDLRRQGADLSQPGPNQNRDTALHMAAAGLWHDGVAYLLKHGVDPNCRNAIGETPLLTLGFGKRAADVARLLIGAGADVHARVGSGRTALGRSDDIQVVRALLAAGADPNARLAQTGQTEFMFACLLGTPDVLAAYLDAGADLKAVDNSGKTALDYARSNRKARTFLAERLGQMLEPADRLRERLKDLPIAAKADAFKAYAARLGEAFNRKPAPWKKRKGGLLFHDVSLSRICGYLGESVPADAEGDHERTEALLARLSQGAREVGFTLFATDTDLRKGRVPLALLPTDEVLAAPLCCGTNANLGGSTTDVVNTLIAIAADDPFDVVACGLDFLDGCLRQPSSDPERLAQRLIDLCPDLVAQSGAALAAASRSVQIRIVADDLQRCGMFGLWWD